MAPYTNIPLSPAELSYLRTSLIQAPPIRPDGRTPTQFRPLVAEKNILPSANGSARVCFADGTEAVVGVKAEVEATEHSAGFRSLGSFKGQQDGSGDVNMDEENSDDEFEPTSRKRQRKGKADWVEVAIEIPGMRDDDALPVFLAAMLTEALLADGVLSDRLYINRRYHWRLYIDILLLSQPLSYPLPLLSLTTHLALLSTRLPALISVRDEDPLFNDDWEASTPLYPTSTKPPVTLLVMSVDSTILFDPSRDELAVADAVLAISCAEQSPSSSNLNDGGGVRLEPATTQAALKLVALRTVDPPSRLTAAGTPNAGGTATLTTAEALQLREKDQGQTVWRPPRGGVRRELIGRMVKMVLEKGGMGEEVMAGLAGVET